MREGNPISEAENDAALDRILSRSLSGSLSGKGEMVPSSGFAASVMRVVQREAAMTAPIPGTPSIPFPWSRALPGLIASFMLTIGMIARVMRTALRAGPQTAMPVNQNSDFVVHGMNLVTNFAANFAANVSTRLTELLTDGLRHAAQMGAGWLLLALLFSWATVQFSLYMADS